MDQNQNPYTNKEQTVGANGQPMPSASQPYSQPQQPINPDGVNGYNYPPQYNAPVFQRTANGQYDRPPQYVAPLQNPYSAPQSVVTKPLYDNRPGSPFFNKEEFSEKRSIRRIGNAVGMALSMFNIGAMVIQLLLIAVMYLVLGVDTTTWQLSDPNTLYLINAVTTLAVLTVPYVFAAKHVGVSLRELVPFSKTSATKVITLVMLGMGVCVLSNFATGMISQIIEQYFGVTTESSMDGYGTGWESFLLMLLCVGILPAILEEFAIRGVVMGLLRKKFSDGAAIMISAAVFGLLHGNLQQIPFAFGVGIILGYATIYTNSLVPAMIIHAINNSMSVVLSFASDSVSPMTSQVITLVYFAVSLLMGLCGFIILAKTDKTALQLSTERTENTKRDTKWFFGSAWMIVFLVFVVISVLGAQGLFSF